MGALAHDASANNSCSACIGGTALVAVCKCPLCSAALTKITASAAATITTTNMSCAAELPRRNEVRKCDGRLCEGENMMKDLSDLLRKINTLKKACWQFLASALSKCNCNYNRVHVALHGGRCASFPPHFNFALKWLELGDSKRSVSANTYRNAKPELRQSKFYLERQSFVDDRRER